MNRYSHINSLMFGQTALPLPISVRVGRSVNAMAADTDEGVFATSVQTGPAAVTVEIRLRGTAVAESLALGTQGDISFTISPTRSGQQAREVTVSGAVLVASDISYAQDAMAVAILRFAAEADDANTEPFNAEDSQ